MAWPKGKIQGVYCSSTSKDKLELTRTKRFWILVALIIAGEGIFFLPFVLPRVFRITLLEVFDISNLELGWCFTTYGIVAIAAYFAGGPLADRFHPKFLMGGALLATGLSGFVLAMIPGFIGLLFLYAFWGLSTIMFFWAALMRITRQVGGVGKSIMAFAIVEGGRGAIAALIAAVGVAILAFAIPDGTELDPVTRKGALQQVILSLSSFVMIAGIIIWWILGRIDVPVRGEEALRWSSVRSVFRLNTVWMQGLIIVCAYSCYRVTDVFPTIIQTYLEVDEITAEAYTAYGLWLRPLAAILGGLAGWKFSGTRIVLICFVIVILNGTGLGMGLIMPGFFLEFLLIAVTSSCAVYALRGAYIAILEESQYSLLITGTVIGVISLIGYLPDVYMATLIGWLMDNHQGVIGLQQVFSVMALFGILGLLVTLRLRKENSKLEITRAGTAQTH